MSDSLAAADGEATAALRAARDALRQHRETISSSPAPLTVLCPPLDLLGLLPAALATRSTVRWRGARSSEARNVLLSRMLPSFQLAVLDVAGSWWEALAGHEDSEDAGVQAALVAWFAPAAPTDSRSGREAAVAVAVSGLQTLLATHPAGSSSSIASPPPGFTISTLALILQRYRLPVVYKHLALSAGADKWSAKEVVAWEAYARALVSLPAKVLNLSQGGQLHPVLGELEPGAVLESVIRGVDDLLWSKQGEQDSRDLRPLGFIIGLLIRQGYASPSRIPSTLASALAIPASTLFAALLSSFLPRLSIDPESSVYTDAWQDVLASGVATFADRARLGEALLRHTLLGVDSPAECAQAGRVMHLLLPIGSEHQLAEKVLLGVEAVGLVGGEGAMEQRARAGVYWVGGGRARNEDALANFLMKVLALWTDLQFIKFSLIAKHTYVLTVLVLLLRSFPPRSLPLQQVASSPLFLNGLTHYLSHPDRAVRYLGMLGAEVVSELTVHEGGKKLDFALWEGEEAHKVLARRLRGLRMDWNLVDTLDERALGWTGIIDGRTASTHAAMHPPSTTASAPTASTSSPPRSIKPRSAKKKAPAKVVVLSDSDDSLTGYLSSSSVSSTRSASPTPSDLDEYISDPTLYNAKKKKVPRPVYLAQLGELLSSRDDPDKLEAGLKWGEALVRRKRGFGLELEENAIYIALVLAGLNDNFELDDFDNRKQGILNALVACAPRKAAPALIEQYFHNQYSLQQRSAILTALAMGAREAAALPTITAANTASVDWPSKRLPPALHRRYVSAHDGNPRLALGGLPNARGEVEYVAGELSSLAIERSREEAESKVNQLQLEKQVRVKRFSKRPLNNPSISPVGAAPSARELGIEDYKDVAAEFFIMPLINRFWLHYDEEDAKTARTTSRYSSTGAGMILSALALSKLLATMSVLVHAARHSPFFLAVIAPETLRLAVTTAGRAAAAKQSSIDDGEISVLGAALELSIVVLDASRELDGGRTLMVDFAGLITAVAEWGQLVFEQTERGERVLGEGGEDEGRVRRNSAGLCVLVAEIRERWVRLAGLG